MSKINFLAFDDQPIIAQCTPKGGGALAILRISGVGAIEIVDTISQLSSKKKLISCSTSTLHHGLIVDNDTTIDEVLFSLMKAPRSFTGQDTVEITTHNNQLIINRVINLCLAQGARLATGGEFCRRACLNDKIDIVQAEAIHEVIVAQNQASLERAMSQLQGSLSEHLEQMQNKILHVLAVSEASLEFSEEEQLDLDFEMLVQNSIDELYDYVRTLKNSSQNSQKIIQGIKVAICGPTNAGKSTLFNALLKEQRAITSDIAGTTRDSINANLASSGQILSLIDTAGIRQTGDEIEKIGIERSWQEAQGADVIVLVFDGSLIFNAESQLLLNKFTNLCPDRLLIFLNKQDQKILPENLDMIKNLGLFANQISAKSNQVEQVEKIINQKIEELFGLQKSPYLLTERHQALLEQTYQQLNSLKKLTQHRLEIELLVVHLHKLLETIAQWSGKNIEKKTMDLLFSSFCIGK